MPAADQETPQDNGRVPVVEPEEGGLSALPAPAAPIVAQVPETPPFELPTAAPSVIDSLVRQMGSSGATAEPSGDVDLTGRLRPITTVDDDTRPPITSILIGAGLLLVAVLVMTNLFGLLDADDGLARTYQLQPTEIDADATAVVHLAPADTGTQFEFEFGGLDASSEDDFYSVWLQRTADGAVAPLGSFHWDVSGSKVVLSGPTGHDDYDMIVITQSSRTAEASATDPVVLSAAID
jgi:hypothetical protein